MTKNTTYNIFVIVFVVLTGAVFGSIAGLIYEERYFWIGTLLGAIGGYGVTKLYLCHLTKIAVKEISKFKIWMLGTLNAVLCGVLCTTFIHLLLAIILILLHERRWTMLTDTLFLVIVFYAELIGAAAGLIVGAIWSLIYVKFPKVGEIETA
jgi:hypothetical protein